MVVLALIVRSGRGGYIVLKQSVLGRVLRYGDIVVLTAAAGAGISNLKQIRRPMEFRTHIVNAKEELEREMGASN